LHPRIWRELPTRSEPERQAEKMPRPRAAIEPNVGLRREIP
jgi:hypothetical protein